MTNPYDASTAEGTEAEEAGKQAGDRQESLKLARRSWIFPLVAIVFILIAHQVYPPAGIVGLVLLAFGFGSLIRAYARAFQGRMVAGKADLVVGTLLNLPLIIWYVVAIHALLTKSGGLLP